MMISDPFQRLNFFASDRKKNAKEAQGRQPVQGATAEKGGFAFKKKKLPVP
jgi:hypothetical protein